MKEEPRTPEPAPAAQDAAVPAAPKPDLGFPSSRRTARSQAPVYAGLLVCGIVLGALLTSLWPQPPAEERGIASTTAAAASAAGAATAPKPAAAQSPMSVIDQSAGPSVTISRLAVAQPTWVVVYASLDGKPGAALGARLFSAADKQGKVGLLRSTEPGQSYFVGLSADNGDRAFSLTKDKQLAGADGKPLWALFRAL
jgi:hypothetical protein